MNDILPVLDTDAPGFSKILENDRWTLAMILDSEPMHLENVTVISRHMETDEVFVLLEGDTFFPSLSASAMSASASSRRRHMGFSTTTSLPARMACIA